MPQFKSYEGQPIRHDLLGAYISGRAQKLAYEQDKARKKLLDEQAAQLAAFNSPKAVALREKTARTENEYKNHLIERDNNKVYEGVGPEGKPRYFNLRDGRMNIIPGGSPASKRSHSIPGAGTGPEYERVLDVLENHPVFQELDDDDLKEVAARVLADAKALQHKIPGSSFSDALTKAMSKHASKIKKGPPRFFGLRKGRPDYDSEAGDGRYPEWDKLELFPNEP